MLSSTSSMLLNELKAQARIMTLETGTYCLFLAQDQQLPDNKLFPAVKVSPLPGERKGILRDNVSIVSFDKEGWLGDENEALLIRIKKGPAQILVSFYEDVTPDIPSLRLQLFQIAGKEEVKAAAIAEKPEYKEKDLKLGHITGHIQEKGDVTVPISDWIGEEGSKLWIEGFEVSPPSEIKKEDLEYQGLLGKDWLSPWVEGGEFCGSRGMSLPLLGLKLRLRGEAAKKWTARVEAVFTDGFETDNSANDKPLESPTLSPLEAFKVSFLEQGREGEEPKQEKKAEQKKAVSSPKKAGKKGDAA